MLLRSIKGIYLLTRLVPVVSWSFCAILLAVGFALHDLGEFSGLHWIVVGLLCTGALLLQGLAAHSLNGRAHVPLLGEWLAAFPAMTACVLVSYHELTGAISSQVVWVSLLHSLLCIAWLMQYHLSDIDANLEAFPRKLTTVTYITLRFGKKYTPLAATAYYILAALLSFVAAVQVNPMFLVSLLCSFLGAFYAWNTNPYNIGNITYNQIRMMVLTVVHTLFLFSFEIFS